MKNEMYLIIDRDGRDDSILARMIDALLKCGFYRRFPTYRDGLEKAKEGLLQIIKQYEPATIMINTDVYGMTDVYKFLKSNVLNAEIINYEEHWI